MRKFSSYGPVNTKIHYYVPRQELVERAILHLVGEVPSEGGHYITVWAPRQRGKSWLLNQALWQLNDNPAYAGFNALKISLEHLKQERDTNVVAQWLANDILEN